MYTCAECSVLACRKENRGNMPKNCPMNNRENIEQIIQEYKKEEIQQFHRTSAIIEHDGYCEWPRLRETIEFAKKIGKFCYLFVKLKNNGRERRCRTLGAVVLIRIDRFSF